MRDSSLRGSPSRKPYVLAVFRGLNGDAKGTTDFRITRARDCSKAAGIMNWGYFIIGLPGEEYWARCAFCEWALRPGPLWTFLKSMKNWPALKSAVNAGWQALGWMW